MPDVAAPTAEPLRDDVIRAWRLSIEHAQVRLGEFNWPWALGLALDALGSARADNERLRSRLDATTRYAEELRDERALLWPAAQVLPTVEAQRDAERAKVQAVEALCERSLRVGSLSHPSVSVEAIRAALAAAQPLPSDTTRPRCYCKPGHPLPACQGRPETWLCHPDAAAQPTGETPVSGRLARLLGWLFVVGAVVYTVAVVLA